MFFDETKNIKRRFIVLDNCLHSSRADKSSFLTYLAKQNKIDLFVIATKIRGDNSTIPKTIRNSASQIYVYKLAEKEYQKLKHDIYS